MSTNTNEIAVRTISDVSAEVSNVGKGQGFYSSIQGESKADKVRLINALQDSEKMQDHLNETLSVVDVVIQATTITDDRTGEVNAVPRVTLVTADGKAISGMSNGLFRAINNILQIMGDPSEWDEPQDMQVVERGPKGNQYYTIVLATA